MRFDNSCHKQLVGFPRQPRLTIVTNLSTRACSKPSFSWCLPILKPSRYSPLIVIYERSSSNLNHKSFADVRVTEADDDTAGIDTLQFLQAAEGITGMFGMYVHTLNHLSQFLNSALLDLLGSAAFSLVQSDLKGNITVKYIPLAIRYKSLTAMNFRKYGLDTKLNPNFLLLLNRLLWTRHARRHEQPRRLFYG